MSTLQLPPPPDGVLWFDESIELDDKTFVLEFVWNSIDSAWFLTVRDADENPLICGIKIVVNVGLLGRYRDIRLPAGELMAIDTSGENREAAVDDIGSRVVLLYMEQATLPASYSLPP